MNLREKLAELEHEQWMAWSKAVANEVSFARLERWRKMWCPYSELTEEQKDQDRKWADKVLQAIGEDKEAGEEQWIQNPYPLRAFPKSEWYEEGD